MSSAPLTARFLSGAMIVFLLITCGFVLSPTPQQQTAPSALTSTVDAALVVSHAGDALTAAARPVTPDRSSTCPQCARPGPIAISLVQLFAAHPLADLIGTALPADEARPALPLSTSQSDPQRLERPPAA